MVARSVMVVAKWAFGQVPTPLLGPETLIDDNPVLPHHRKLLDFGMADFPGMISWKKSNRGQFLPYFQI